MRAATFVKLILVVVILVGGTLHLETAPGVWWDEGWSLSVARNWVERGHYGRLLEGEPASNGLEAAFPVILPVAFFFKIFGVGVWQGRLPGLLLTLGSLALLYLLAARLYSSKVAWAAIYAVLFLLPLGSVNPIILGRQVLADLPMMFYLLAGFLGFLLAWMRPFPFLPLSVVLWGIAIITKAQTLSFWLVSLTVPLVLALIQKQWKSFGLLVLGISGSWVASTVLLSIQSQILQGHTLPGTPVQGIYQAVAAVALINVRIRSWTVLAVSGLPTLLGLIYFAVRYQKKEESLTMKNGEQVVKLAVFVLTATWLGWFALLSNGGPRYLAAPAFLGGIFVAVLLDRLTDHFDFRGTILRAAEVLKLHSSSRPGFSAVFAIALAVPMALFTLWIAYPILFHRDDSAIQVARYLNTQTSQDDLIETYESELFFMLDRPYHYPPDQVHVDLIRRYYFEQEFEIDYDPLKADPDYLVVGGAARAWQLYDPVLDGEIFRLVLTKPPYQVFERNR